MHRRKSSKEEHDSEFKSNETPPAKAISSQVPFPQNGKGDVIEDKSSRSRINSAPIQPASSPGSPSTYRSSFVPPGSPNLNGNGFMSPYKQSFGHSRNRSTSGGPYYMRHSQSPLARSNSPPQSSQPFPGSPTLPTATTTDGNASATNSRRHSRIHSRNLSIFFPRPGSLPHSAIDEDGGQDIEYGGRVDEEAPVSLIPSSKSMMQIQAPPGRRRLGDGFTFGGQANGTDASAANGTVVSPVSPSNATRRGHHHKHSLSHSFFSFIEPGSQQHTHTQSNSSSHLHSPVLTGHSLSVADIKHQVNDTELIKPTSIPKLACLAAILQFILGASLWVSGQQSGSLGCTGVGYWIVFDAFGIAIGHILPAYLSLESLRSPMRRPFGNARIETLMQFSQAVYLVFASVYVCKETVEHLLLSAGNGHHHHPGDEIQDMIGISYPTFLIFITMISLLGTCLFYSNHSKLIEVAGHKLPSITSLIPRLRTRNVLTYSLPTSKVATVLLNPFTAAPLSFSSALLAASLFLPPSQHRPFDLLLASVETVITFIVAYPACVVLGTVLLQTSPSRGIPGGRTEAFLRVMRELERHPDVLHLPAPHIWQLTPSIVSQRSLTTNTANAKEPLVISLELHVRKSLDDAKVVQLTRWAHDRCKGALSISAREKGVDDGSEVTVGIVKG